MDNLFKALNDATRREILILLKEKSCTAGEISAQFAISKPSISHHLDLLKQADLIKSIKKGQFIHYSINKASFDELIDWFDQFKPNLIVKQEIFEKPRYRIELGAI